MSGTVLGAVDKIVAKQIILSLGLNSNERDLLNKSLHT